MMKVKRILSAVAALSLLAGSALADGSMTAGELSAIWQQSFSKMNTTSELRSFTDLPGESDLSYAEALAIARQTIFDRYGTPEDELDAMGVYPDYIAAWEGEPAEWRFFFTPMRDTSIDLDHDFPAPGEYRVYLNSPSGEVTFANWYIDDFWPYAQRAWDAGKGDVVLDQAGRGGFLRLPPEVQESWLAALEGAGYDVTDIRSGAALFRDGLFLLELKSGENRLPADPDTDPLAARAWQALTDTFGLDTALMRRYHYEAFRLADGSAPRDVFILYDRTATRDMQRGGDVDHWCSRLLAEVDRLGYFLVRFDPQTGEALYVTHGDHAAMPIDEGDPATLLGRPQWNAEDLLLLDEAYRNLEAIMTKAVEEGLRRDEQKPIADEFMRSLGGSAIRYDGVRETSDIGLDAGLPIAVKAAAEAAGMSEEDFTARFTVETARGLPELNEYEYWFIHVADTGETMYYVCLDAATGEVKQAAPSQGNG